MSDQTQSESDGLPSLVDETSQFLTQSILPHLQSASSLGQTLLNAPSFSSFYGQSRIASTVLGAIGINPGTLGNLSTAATSLIGKIVGDGSIPKGIETLAQFKARHGDVGNIPESNNPLGLAKIVMSLVSQLSSLGSSTSAETLGEQIDALRYSIYAINAKVIAAGTIAAALDLTQLIDSDSDLSRLKRFLVQLVDYPDDESIVSTASFPDAETQLIKLRAFAASLVSTITACQQKLPDGFDDPIASIKTKMSDVVVDIDSVLSTHVDIASSLNESISIIDPRAGAFKALGANQIFDVANFLSGGSGGSWQNDPLFKNFRKTYVENGLSSYPAMATDFGNKGTHPRDTAEAISGKFTPMPRAVPSNGVGDKVASDSSVESQSAASPDDGPVGPLDKTRWQAYKKVLAVRESGDNYTIINRFGFIGKYQFGASALIDMGYVRAGTSNRGMVVDSNWLGKDGVTSREDFLKNVGQCQDKAMVKFTMNNYQALLKGNAVNTGSSPRVVAGYLAAAHLKGVGGAIKLSKGVDNSDANGTKASSYYNMMASIDGGVPQNGASQTSASNGGSVSAQTKAFVDSSQVPDSVPISFPKADTSSPRYPYNKIRVFEGGHFKEYDSTPGNERIQERHRLGTGYEIDANGMMKTLVVKDRYTAIMGTDWVMIKGHCHITTDGDVCIRAGGNFNVNCQDFNVVASGNMNIDVAGDTRAKHDGARSTIVRGDDATHVDGFSKTAANGAIQIEGTSAAMVARGGDASIVAKGGASIQALGTASISGKTKTSISSKGDVAMSSGGTLGGYGKSSIGFESGGGVGMKSAGAMTMNSSGKMALNGSGGIASSSAIPTGDSTTYSYGGKSEATAQQASYDKQTDKDSGQPGYDDSIKQFESIDGKTQANNRGGAAGTDV